MREIFKKLGMWVTIALAFLLLFTCYLYYRPIEALPVLDSMSSLVPMLWLANGLLVLLWLTQRDWAILIPVLALGVSFLAFDNYYRFSSPPAEISTGGLRVMSYNAHSLGINRWRKNEDIRDSILAFIKREDPDILCLQEYSAQARKFLRRDYPFYTETPAEAGKTFQAIFSKFPMISGGMVEFPDSRNNTLYADIDLGVDTIRVYNVHLQSYGIGSRRFLMREYGTRFLKRLSAVSRLHRQQVELVRTHQRQAPHASLICGDFNSSPFSNAYRQMKEGLQDSFAERGTGLGTTYSLKGIPYRIDYILADPAFEVRAHRNYGVRLSDHYPLMATLALKGQ